MRLSNFRFILTIAITYFSIIFSADMNQVTAKYPIAATMAQGWELIVVLVLLLILFVVALLYAFAYAFGLDKLKSTTKSFLVDILVTILFMMFLFGVLFVFDELASSISRQVAREVYGLTNPSLQKLEFNVDVNRAVNHADIFSVFSSGEGILTNIGTLLTYPRLFPVMIANHLFTKPYIQTGPYYKPNGKYLVMTFDASDYRTFAEAILRKNIFCAYSLWEYGRRTLVILTTARSFSYEQGGFDPSTAAAVQIPVDVVKKAGPPTVTLAMFMYSLIHLIRLTTVFAPVFIIIGIILRSFMLTRPIGAFLLSLGIVLWIFFPLAIVVFMGNAKSFAAKCKMVEVPKLAVDPCTISNFNLYFAAQAQLDKQLHKTRNSIARTYMLVVSMWQETILGFLATLVFTFSLIRALSGIFGSDISEIGRGLVKFV